MNKKSAKTILVAEDDSGIIDVMKIILQDEGYNVVAAKNESEITKIIERILPNLIFLDIRLGGENGSQIARKLRTEEKTAAIPLIIVSGDSQTEAIAKEVNASSYLAKPFDIQVLLSVVKKYISS